MIMSLFKSNRGSTLVLVLVTMSILSLLGTVILSASVVNLKLKISEGNVKTTFYLAESGLEEAYAIVRDQISKAIDAGNANATNELNTFIAAERKHIYAPPNKSPYLNDDGSINEEACYTEMNGWFEAGYKQYLDGEGAGNGLEAVLKEISNNVRAVQEDIDDKIPTITLVSDRVTKFGARGRNYSFSLQSNFVHKGIVRTIQANYNISIPAYDAPFYTQNQKVELAENILWKRAITAEGNLYITGTDVEINGDVYAYGTKPAGSKAPVTSYGGIIIGDPISGSPVNLTINGEVDTDSYIYTNGNNTNVTIKTNTENNGNVFCDSLGIPDVVDNSSITVQGNVHTYDDLELNGTKAVLNIAGNYYGFSDGSANTHLQSSSIVINSPDIVNFSGEGTPESYLLIGGQAYIAGTVHIDLDHGTYQSGESISVKENYKAYTRTLIENIKRDPASHEHDANINGNFNNVGFTFYEPLFLVDRFGTGDQFNVIDKSMYFKYYQDDYGDLNLAGPGISIGGIPYSTGAVINQSMIHSSNVNGANMGFIHEKSDEYKHRIYRFNDPAESEERSETVRIRIADEVGQYGKFKFSRNFYPSEAVVNQSKELFYINSDSGKDIAIIGKDGNNLDLPSNIDTYSLQEDRFYGDNEQPLKGIIVTRGDVYLRGQLDFEGIIVTEGDVYIQDSQKKVFRMDQDKDTGVYGYVLRKVYETFGENTSISNTNPFVHNGTARDFIYVTAVGTENLSSYQRYEDVVAVEWLKIK